MKKMSLSLNTDPDSDQDSGNGEGPGTPDSTPPADQENSRQSGGISIIGGGAVAFGLLGIFSMGYIFVPLALICSLIALFMGQMSWAFIGLLLTVAGFITSPVLLGILGIAWLIP
jgi:hypothetical protein